MLIDIEIISENIFDNISLEAFSFINLKNMIKEKYLVPIKNQEWFFNDNKIDDFIDISCNIGIYTVYLSNNLINLKIKNKNKIIKLPYLSKSLTIKELKNILSIKDNIYLNNINLLNNKKLSDYQIKSNDILILSIDNLNLNLN
jgi:hypothetical protein